MNRTPPSPPTHNYDEGSESVNGGGSSSNGSEHHHPDTNTSNELEHERATLGRRESRVVVRMTIIMSIVLFVSTFFVATFVFKYVEYDQEENFKNAFEGDATKLIEAFQQTMKQQLESIDALSVAITSHALATNSAFPNVTLPDFEVRFANTRVLSGSFLAAYYPYVTDTTRKGWEAYMLENYNRTIAKAFKSETTLRNQQDMKHNNNNQSIGRRTLQEGQGENSVIPGIFSIRTDGTPEINPPNSGPYLPLWQLSPIPPEFPLQNYNAFTSKDFSESHNATMQSNQAVISIATNLKPATEEDKGGFYSLLISLSQYRNDVAQYSGDPTSTVSYPVFESFDTTKRKAVGVIGTVVYWSLFFKDVLPPNTKGIICVVENSRGQQFTYRIDGNVTYLGNGDRHNKKYDGMGKSSEDNVKASSITSESFTSVGLDESYCKYSIRVYPSQDTEDVYVNNDPIYASLVVELVFLFTSIMFISYTIAVNRRQRVVMNRAVASSAIVSSLFPSQVRDQIYQETTTTAEQAAKKDGGFDGKRDSMTNGGNETNTARPIASVFEKTTIMFADMVGFTKWSSTREPVQVFELLETLYQAFDAIAVRRKVFKVETIGDCYVAVTGLPEPQEDHAVIITKFADECMAKMGELTKELVDVLGLDTADLAMRVGLHSGSVTGGVLRGQKSRFQLFGDTMNTASRMESNGMAHRIHVSQETANELIAKGKSHWVTPREDKIVAKGKGELQTYWVSVRSTSETTKSLRSDSVVKPTVVVDPPRTSGRKEARRRQHQGETFEL